MSLSRRIKDKKRRGNLKKFEQKRRVLKAIIKNQNLSTQIRDECTLLLARLPRDSSSTRIKNRCIFTGRPRSTLRFFKISRITFKELVAFGHILGVKKSSW
uniref:Small ribosomal subunit protein uS14m n=1 Tax=Entransia fimbriata TaxID=130991 RepID=U5YGU2_9VIRI|nr:ribosomal protein S14 [Entransia fimbriata]AGZ90306.1 ribosomal protein S14 [Entransia fimbriata]